MLERFYFDTPTSNPLQHLEKLGITMLIILRSQGGWIQMLPLVKFCSFSLFLSHFPPSETTWHFFSSLNSLFLLHSPPLTWVSALGNCFATSLDVFFFYCTVQVPGHRCVPDCLNTFMYLWSQLCTLLRAHLERGKCSRWPLMLVASSPLLWSKKLKVQAWAPSRQPVKDVQIYKHVGSRDTFSWRVNMLFSVYISVLQWEADIVWYLVDWGLTEPAESTLLRCIVLILI